MAAKGKSQRQTAAKPRKFVDDNACEEIDEDESAILTDEEDIEPEAEGEFDDFIASEDEEEEGAIGDSEDEREDRDDLSADETGLETDEEGEASEDLEAMMYNDLPSVCDEDVEKGSGGRPVARYDNTKSKPRKRARANGPAPPRAPKVPRVNPPIAPAPVHSAAANPAEAVDIAHCTLYHNYAFTPASEAHNIPVRINSSSIMARVRMIAEKDTGRDLAGSSASAVDEIIGNMSHAYAQKLISNVTRQARFRKIKPTGHLVQEVDSLLRAGMVATYTLTNEMRVEYWGRLFDFLKTHPSVWSGTAWPFTDAAEFVLNEDAVAMVYDATMRYIRSASAAVHKRLAPHDNDLGEMIECTPEFRNQADVLGVAHSAIDLWFNRDEVSPDRLYGRSYQDAEAKAAIQIQKEHGVLIYDHGLEVKLKPHIERMLRTDYECKTKSVFEALAKIVRFSDFEPIIDTCIRNEFLRYRMRELPSVLKRMLVRGRNLCAELKACGRASDPDYVRKAWQMVQAKRIPPHNTSRSFTYDEDTGPMDRLFTETDQYRNWTEYVEYIARKEVGSSAYTEFQNQYIANHHEEGVYLEGVAGIRARLFLTEKDYNDFLRTCKQRWGDMLAAHRATVQERYNASVARIVRKATSNSKEEPPKNALPSASDRRSAKIAAVTTQVLRFMSEAKWHVHNNASADLAAGFGIRVLCLINGVFTPPPARKRVSNYGKIYVQFCPDEAIAHVRENSLKKWL